MKSTVKAFQDLYVSFGGSLTDTYSDIAGGIPVGDYNVKPDMIEALAKITGGSIELPKVTSADNRKVLAVVDGQWAKRGVEVVSGLCLDGTTITGGGNLPQHEIVKGVLNGSVRVDMSIPDYGIVLGVFPIISHNGPTCIFQYMVHQGGNLKRTVICEFILTEQETTLKLKDATMNITVIPDPTPEA